MVKVDLVYEEQVVNGSRVWNNKQCLGYILNVEKVLSRTFFVIVIRKKKYGIDVNTQNMSWWWNTNPPTIPAFIEKKGCIEWGVCVCELRDGRMWRFKDEIPKLIRFSNLYESIKQMFELHFALDLSYAFKGRSVFDDYMNLRESLKGEGKALITSLITREINRGFDIP